MKSRSLLSQIIRIFAVVFVIILVIVAIITGIGWWAGWQTEANFKTAIQIAGLVLIGIGFLGIKGNQEKSRRFQTEDSMSVSEADAWQRTQVSLCIFTQNYSFLLIMFVSGGICLVIGMLM